MVLINRLLERIRERYLTWRTGKNKEQRDWEAWYEVNVNYRAHDITDMFKNFEHVLTVNWQKFLDLHDPFGWVPVKDAKQYFWPQRELGSNAVFRIERVSWSQWDGRWHIDSMGGEDRVFVATNNYEDAMIIALKWA